MHSGRQLVWDGCVNVRDLGGPPTEEGTKTAYGAVVLADNLTLLSDEGWDAVVEYGVNRIVDLRWADERANDPAHCHSVHGYLVRAGASEVGLRRVRARLRP